MKKKKIMFISSTGGHLSELSNLFEMFDKYDSYLVTEKTKLNKKYKYIYKNRVSYLLFGSKDRFLIYPFKFIYNCFKTLFIFIKVRPKYIISTGAHTAVPMCYIGKIFGSKIIWIETMANVTSKTLSGKLVYPISDLFIVQWEEMLKLYPKAVYRGWIY